MLGDRAKPALNEQLLIFLCVYASYMVCQGSCCFFLFPPHIRYQGNRFCFTIPGLSQIMFMMQSDFVPEVRYLHLFTFVLFFQYTVETWLLTDISDFSVPHLKILHLSILFFERVNFTSGNII